MSQYYPFYDCTKLYWVTSISTIYLTPLDDFFFDSFHQHSLFAIIISSLLSLRTRSSFLYCWHNHRYSELTLATMSGFFSRGAEAALSAQEAEARRNLYRTTAHDPFLAERASRSPYQQQWMTVQHPAMTSAHSHTSPDAFSTPVQYSSWPSLNPNAFARGQYAPPAPHVLPSSPYSSEQHWPVAPWPTLHPDDVNASSDSRSTSPNPADLHNFGFPLPDGRSWRCAYPNCTSQVAFTRGCDLRKHYRRHTKSLFCRHEECPQSREGGFSSRKDRDRHESKVRPVVSCWMIDIAD